MIVRAEDRAVVNDVLRKADRMPSHTLSDIPPSPTVEELYGVLIRSYRRRRRNLEVDFLDAFITIGRWLGLPADFTMVDIHVRVAPGHIDKAHIAAVWTLCPHEIPVVCGYDAGIVRQQATGLHAHLQSSLFFARVEDAVLFKLMWDGS